MKRSASKFALYTSWSLAPAVRFLSLFHPRNRPPKSPSRLIATIHLRTMQDRSMLRSRRDGNQKDECLLLRSVCTELHEPKTRSADDSEMQCLATVTIAAKR